MAADEATAAGGLAPVPLLVKIAPDLSDDDVDAVAELAAELGLDGIVAVNTTIGHDLGPGGLSGPPVLARGLDVVARLRSRLGPDAVIIGVGGITTPADAREYLAVGATLVQGYTGLIYEGPAYATADRPRARGGRGAPRSRSSEGGRLMVLRPQWEWRFDGAGGAVLDRPVQPGVHHPVRRRAVARRALAHAGRPGRPGGAPAARGQPGDPDDHAPADLTALTPSRGPERVPRPARSRPAPPTRRRARPPRAAGRRPTR